MTTGIGDAFTSWQLALNLEGPDPFQSASSQKITTYIWTGILMTAGIVLLSLLLAGYLRRQLRLTRLKNDLIANVSHELKTPLASMRLLVDTLRDGHYQDTQLVQEYLADDFERKRTAQQPYRRIPHFLAHGAKQGEIRQLPSEDR